MPRLERTRSAPTSASPSRSRGRWRCPGVTIDADRSGQPERARTTAASGPIDPRLPVSGNTERQHARHQRSGFLRDSAAAAHRRVRSPMLSRARSMTWNSPTTNDHHAVQERPFRTRSTSGDIGPPDRRQHRYPERRSPRCCSPRPSRNRRDVSPTCSTCAASCASHVPSPERPQRPRSDLRGLAIPATRLRSNQFWQTSTKRDPAVPAHPVGTRAVARRRVRRSPLGVLVAEFTAGDVSGGTIARRTS